MVRLHLVVLALVAGGTLCSLGCSDDDSPGGGGASTTAQGAGGQGASGGEGGTAGGGATAAVAVTVTVTDRGSQPIGAAGVAVDLENESRVEGLTDAQGAVELQLPAGIDVRSIIAHKDGYAFVAAEGGLLEGTEWGLWLAESRVASTRVDISGTALHMVDPLQDLLVVHASTGSFFTQWGTDQFSLAVPTGEPFDLIGFDFGPPVVDAQQASRVWNALVVTSHAGLNSNATIDLDFSASTPPSSTFATSVALPADPTLASTGVPMVEVWTQPGTIEEGPVNMVGGSDTCLRNGTQFDCDGQLWDVAGTPGATVYWVVEPSRLSAGTAGFRGRWVHTWLQGGPIAGLVHGDYPNPPDATSPSGPGPHPVDELVQFSLPAGGGEATILMGQVNASDGRLIGLAYPFEGQVRVPALPSTSDPATVFEDSMDFALFRGRSEWGNFATTVACQGWEATPPAR